MFTFDLARAILCKAKEVYVTYLKEAENLDLSSVLATASTLETNMMMHTPKQLSNITAVKLFEQGNGRGVCHDERKHCIRQQEMAAKFAEDVAAIIRSNYRYKNIYRPSKQSSNCCQGAQERAILKTAMNK